MKTMEVPGYYFPPGFVHPFNDFRVRSHVRGDSTVHVKVPAPSPELVGALADHLKTNRNRHLVRMPVERIILALDRASRRWLDPDDAHRKQALEILPVITGFSRAAVAASIDLEMETSLSHDMWRALRSEIGNPLYLDDFQYSRDLGGYSRAFGPELMVSFFSGNIPSLPHLLFMRAALVKSACLGKVASGEPAFAALYLKTLEEIDPEMVESMAALYWEGGEKSVEDALFCRADAVVVFGGVETCASLLERIPRHVRTLVHGHKTGFGVIGKNRLKHSEVHALARDAAYDHAMFDQQACLAPQAYFVEKGGDVPPEDFARLIARAMEEMEERMPRGGLSPGQNARVHQLRARYEIRELAGEPVRVFAPAQGTAWTVVYEPLPQAFQPSPLNRFVRLWGVEDIDRICGFLKPMATFLQNAAVAMGDEREGDLVRRLAALGVCRITRPGNMPVPSMMWHHDGIATLASLLRWCDVEKKEDMEGVFR